MTVCIAARSSGGMIFCASDRMLTSGDIQFEPPSQKVLYLTVAILAMTSGDAAFQSEILQGVTAELAEKLKGAAEWFKVKDAADLYVKHRNIAKLKRAEAVVLAPLGLNADTFRQQQAQMDKDLVGMLAKEMINFDVPDVSAIIAGIDTSPHIYLIENGHVPTIYVPTPPFMIQNYMREIKCYGNSRVANALIAIMALYPIAMIFISISDNDFLRVLPMIALILTGLALLWYASRRGTFIAVDMQKKTLRACNWFIPTTPIPIAAITRIGTRGMFVGAATREGPCRPSRLPQGADWQVANDCVESPEVFGSV